MLSFRKWRSTDIFPKQFATPFKTNRLTSNLHLKDMTKVRLRILENTPATLWQIGLGTIQNQTALDTIRSEEHTSELQSRPHLVCRLLLEKKKNTKKKTTVK